MIRVPENPSIYRLGRLKFFPNLKIFLFRKVGIASLLEPAATLSVIKLQRSDTLEQHHDVVRHGFLPPSATTPSSQCNDASPK